MELQQIYQQAKGGNSHTAFESLREWLMPGRKALYRKVSDLEKRSRSQSPENIQQALLKTVAEIQQLPEREIQFLNLIQKGIRQMEAKEWEQAKTAYQAALALHQPTYQLKEEEIQKRLKTTCTALEMEDLVAKGNEAYAVRNWEEAEKCFQQVMDIHQRGLGVDAQELTEVIAHCNQGRKFASIVSQAQQASWDKQYEKAYQFYQTALRFSHADYVPGPEVLQLEMKQVQQILQDSQRSGMAFWQKSNILVIGVALLTLLIGFGLWWGGDVSLGKDSEPSLDSYSQVGELREAEQSPNSLPETYADQAEAEAYLAYADSLAEAAADGEVEASVAYTPAPSDEEWVPADYWNSIEVVQSPDKTQQEVKQPISNSAPTSSAELPAGVGPSQVLAENQLEDRGIEKEKASQTLVDTQTNLPAPILDSMVPATSLPATETRIVAENKSPVEEKPAPKAAESPAPTPAAPAKPLAFAEVMPSFPGGEAAMAKFLSRRINYPEIARENEIEGTVYVQMVVQTDGSLTKIRLARGIGYGCDEEALKVVRQMPRWEPGQQGGRTVPVIYTIPIIFRIP